MTTAGMHCADCGQELDLFGICPMANPDRARVERAPVNCGLTPIEAARELNRRFEGAIVPGVPTPSGMARFGLRREWDKLFPVGGAR
jgi:hypothetical protein